MRTFEMESAIHRDSVARRELSALGAASPRDLAETAQAFDNLRVSPSYKLDGRFGGGVGRRDRAPKVSSTNTSGCFLSPTRVKRSMADDWGSGAIAPRHDLPTSAVPGHDTTVLVILVVIALVNGCGV